MAFECPKCSRVSHNENDEKHRYCGNCHKFYPAKSIEECPHFLWMQDKDPYAYDFPIPDCECGKCGAFLGSLKEQKPDADR